MPDINEIFTGLLSTAYQMDETGVASLKKEDGTFKDDALQTILSKDQERVTALKGDSKRIGEEKYSQGKRETADALEKELKSVFGIKETDKKGKELIEYAKGLLLENSGKLTEEQIKKHQAYLNLEQARLTDAERINKEWETKLSSEVSKYERERTLSEIVDAANVLLDNLKPVLPSDAAKAKKLRGVFDNEIKALNYEVKTLDDGKKRYLLLDKEGKRIEDAHGNPISFDAKVKEIAESYFDLQAAENRTGAGDPNKKNEGADSGNFEFKKPANRDELNKMLLEIESKYPTLKERSAAKKKVMDLFNA